MPQTKPQLPLVPTLNSENNSFKNHEDKQSIGPNNSQVNASTLNSQQTGNQNTFYYS